MAVLSDADRAAATRLLVKKAFVDLNQTANLTTDQVRTLINDLDNYVDANSVQINNAISQPVRGTATPEVKALAMAWVALKRAGAV